MGTAKEQVLARIRQANSGKSSPAYDSISRRYNTAGMMSVPERLGLFEDRLADYGAGVYRCSASDVAEVVGEVMRRGGRKSLVVPAEIPPSWLRPDLGPPMGFVVDHELSYAELDASEGVLTGCALAIAETGTIVLAHSHAQGRRALTLIPDYHVCVVCEEQIVESVVEGMRAIAQLGSVPITTISGPSATSDIEMTRIKGVHGPRTLDVVIVVAPL